MVLHEMLKRRLSVTEHWGLVQCECGLLIAIFFMKKGTSPAVPLMGVYAIADRVQYVQQHCLRLAI